MFSTKISLSCLLAGLAVMSVSVSSQEFAELEERLKLHPALEKLGYEAEADREHAIAATALPDPELSLNINNVPLANPSFDRFLPSNKGVGIRQMFPNRAAREARSARILGGAEQTEALASALYAELRGQLIVELIALDRIAQQQELAHARNRRYDELVEVVEAEINAGRPALFRLAEIERERSNVARALVELSSEMIRTNASITEKVGPVASTSVPPVVGKEWNQDPQYFHAVRVAEFDTAIADESINEARASWKTNWGVHFTYKQRSSGRDSNAPFSGDDWFSAGVTFSLPVWGKRRQAPNVRAAAALRMSAQAGVRQIAKQSIARYESLQALEQAATANKQVLLGKIEAVQAQIIAQQTNYESGAGDYSPIIDGELVVLSLRAQIVDEEARALSSIVLSNALLVTP